MFRDLQTELKLTKEVLIGRSIGSDEYRQKILVLKTWKGVVKSDTITIRQGNDSCHKRLLFPANEFFLIYLDQEGIHNCSRTTGYNNAVDIKALDSIYKQSLWMNKNELTTLSEIEYARKYIIQTDKGAIDVNDKKVVYNVEGKIRSKENLPANPNDFYAVKFFLIATKDSIENNPCEIDYIVYVNQVHQDMTLLETKREKIERKSLRLACR
jgi:hypothetical protein